MYNINAIKKTKCNGDTCTFIAAIFGLVGKIRVKCDSDAANVRLRDYLRFFHNK